MFSICSVGEAGVKASIEARLARIFARLHVGAAERPSTNNPSGRPAGRSIICEEVDGVVRPKHGRERPPGAYPVPGGRDPVGRRQLAGEPPQPAGRPLRRIGAGGAGRGRRRGPALGRLAGGRPWPRGAHRPVHRRRGRGGGSLRFRPGRPGPAGHRAPGHRRPHRARGEHRDLQDLDHRRSRDRRAPLQRGGASAASARARARKVQAALEDISAEIMVDISLSPPS